MGFYGGQSQQSLSLIGTTIADRFEVLAFAAAGGMGHIYRARDRTSGDTVALKLLAPATGVAERFTREAAALATLDHPAVVRHLAHGKTSDGEQYLAMEWLEGQDLADRLGASGVLELDEAITLARQVADGLAAVHRAGIVHRDIKPANIFLVDHRFEKVKVLDFGVARTGPSELTITGTVVGTPAYMAPEQIREDAIGPAADVYGFGALLFRCLAGRAPFDGDYQLAVLAKVMIEPPPSIREIRPDVPHALDAFIQRLLSKDPKERPRDGAALLAELPAARSTKAGTGGVPSSERRIRATISAREKRVACIVLCAGGTAFDPTLVEEAAAHANTSARKAVERHGGSIDAITKGAWLVTIPNTASPREQALRAARCALALAAVRPDAPVCIATGRILVTGEGRVGEVIDRATAALLEAKGAAQVHVDAATAELLEGHFRLEGDGEWRLLIGEQTEVVAPVRTLLGKPAPCVGRDAQLAMLHAALAACADESRAGAALVVAPIGLGKTRLVRELLRVSATQRPDLDVLYANGEPMRAGSAFGLASQILTRAAGIRDSDSSDERRARLAMLVSEGGDGDRDERMRELLGELCGVVTPTEDASPAMRAARADLSVMADALRDAWTAWIAARASRGSVLILLEDVHWADAASLRLIEGALTKLADRSLFVLGTSRPEGSAVFVERFRSAGLVEITLARLSAVAAERLVRGALAGTGRDVAPELVNTLVHRAGGHPFHLEELVRAVADGQGPEALPDSVLGTVQARLDDLSPDARRLLRAASVFGETFRVSGVAALMGDEISEYDVQIKLGQLVEQEVVTEEKSSKFAKPAWRDSGATHSFRHILFRDVAYATLTDVDCTQAHLRAAMWLQAMGETDPAVLGEHFERGGAPERAVGFFHRAAAQALQRNDFERARDHTQHALTLHPEAATEAALRAIEAEILYWRGEITTAAERAPSALARLARGTTEWFDAISVTAGALGQLGRNDEVATILRDAAQLKDPSASREAQIVALCRGMTQLFWAHAGAGLADVRACLDALVDHDRDSSKLDAYPRGWVHRVRGEAAWLYERDIAKCLAELDASCAAFADARALRPLCLSRLNAASLSGWSGDPKRGLELVAAARIDAERLGAGFLLSYGRAVEGLLLAYAGDAAASDVLMRRALTEVAGNPRLAFICHFVLASAALDRGDIAAADRDVRPSESLRVVDDLRAAGFGLASRIASARGENDEALRLATKATEIDARCVDLELTYGTSGLALAEAHLARGDRAAARVALTPVASTVAAIAATIPNATQRAHYMQRPLANDRIASLARDLAMT